MKCKTILRHTLLSILVLIFVTFSVRGQNENNFEISKNLEIFISMFNELNKSYVDDINPGELMETGIESMLKTTDPYTVYIPESQVEDYRMITTGQYGGIGSLIHRNGEYVVISEPYEGYPAHKSGLKAGDRLLQINGEDMVNKPSDEVSKFLKGQPGTSVSLLVERDGEDAPLEFEINRENITIKDIPHYGMLNEHIGYIKLTGFTQQAGNEVKKALIDLKSNNEVEGIILDLRNNGGGLLGEAVNITNIFVDKGQLNYAQIKQINEQLNCTNIIVKKLSSNKILNFKILPFLFFIEKLEAPGYMLGVAYMFFISIIGHYWLGVFGRGYEMFFWYSVVIAGAIILIWFLAWREWLHSGIMSLNKDCDDENLTTKTSNQQ